MVNKLTSSAFRSLLTGFLLLCGFELSAQSLNITCGSDTVTSDQQFIVVLDGEMGNFSNFAVLPDVPGLVVISHNESYNYNASSKNAIVHQSYVMKAIAPGDYTIGPAWIQSGTRRLYSNTVRIHVSKGNSPIGSGDIFMRAEPEKKTVYTGEKVKVALRLYHSDEVYVSGDYPMAHSYSGFWKADDQEYSYDSYEYDDSIVYIKGKRFTRRTLMTETLYPNAVGDITLPAYTYSCYISGDYDDAYNYDSYDMSFDLLSEQNTINVLPLLDHDSLPGFSGDVGRFKIRCTLNADSTNAWEPVVYTMWVSGEGNFQFMMAPDLSLPGGLRSQNTMNSDTMVWDGADYVAGKMFRYLITPENEGEYDLSSIAYSYFDPKKKEYVTVYSDSFHLHVSPGVQLEGETVSNLPDSFFSKKEKSNAAIIITVCVILLGVPLLAFFFIRAKKKKRLKAEAEQARLEAEKEIPEYVPPPDTSREQANALLHGASQYLQNGLLIQSVNNLYEAMIARFIGITKMRREEISVNTLRYRLRLAKINEDLINDIILHFEDLKLKRYTIAPGDAAAAHVFIVRTADLLQKIG